MQPALVCFKVPRTFPVFYMHIALYIRCHRTNPIRVSRSEFIDFSDSSTQSGCYGIPGRLNRIIQSVFTTIGNQATHFGFSLPSSSVHCTTHNFPWHSWTKRPQKVTGGHCNSTQRCLSSSSSSCPKKMYGLWFVFDLWVTRKMRKVSYCKGLKTVTAISQSEWFSKS